MKIKTILFKIFRSFFLCITAIILFPYSCSTGTADNGKGMRNFQRPQNRVEGEYLLKLNMTGSKEDIEKYFQDYKIVEIRLIRDRLYKLKIEKDPGPDVLRKIAKDSGKFEYIEPNYIYRAAPQGTTEKLKPLKQFAWAKNK